MNPETHTFLRQQIRITLRYGASASRLVHAAGLQTTPNWEHRLVATCIPAPARPPSIAYVARLVQTGTM